MSLALGKSKQTKTTETATSFTQNAAVQTTAPQPLIEEVKQPEPQPAENKQPWHSNTSMSEEELMYVKQKKSYDIPIELLLRLEFLRSNEKPKAFGQKIYESAQLIEALDEYTAKRLEALGHSVK